MEQKTKAQKSKTKFAFKTLALVLGFVLVIGGLFAGIILIPKTKKMSDQEKFTKILAQTSQIIEQNNNKLVDNYNAMVEAQKGEAFTHQAMKKAYAHDGEYLLEDALWSLNDTQRYYTYFEYINEFLNTNFFNKTYKLVQNYYSYDYYASVRFEGDNVVLRIYSPEDNEGRIEIEFIQLTLNYDVKTLEPIKLTRSSHFCEPPIDNYIGSNDYTYYTIDFANSRFYGGEVGFDQEVEWNNTLNLNDDYINQHLKDVENYYIEYDNLASLEAMYIWSIEPGDLDLELSEYKDAILQHCKTFNYFKSSNVTDYLDLDNATDLEATEMMLYAENKYSITPTADGEKLVAKKVYGMKDEIINALNYVYDLKMGDIEEPESFKNFDFVYHANGDSETQKYDGQNMKKTIFDIEMSINEQDFQKAVDWVDNVYDSETFYYKPEEYEDLIFFINNYYLAIIKNAGEEIEIAMVGFYTYTYNEQKVIDYCFDYYKIGAEQTEFYCLRIEEMSGILKTVDVESGISLYNLLKLQEDVTNDDMVHIGANLKQYEGVIYNYDPTYSLGYSYDRSTDESASEEGKFMCEEFYLRNDGHNMRFEKNNYKNISIGEFNWEVPEVVRVLLDLA